jgi:hypothetical protein
MTRTATLLCFVLLVATASCAASGAKNKPTDCDLAVSSMAEPERWWERPGAKAGECPAGAKRVQMEKVGATFCALGDGRRHGPSRAESKGTVLEEGVYLFGERQGPWKRYDGVLRAWVNERYTCGHLDSREQVEAPAAETGGP